MENTPPTSRTHSPSRTARQQRSRSPLQSKRSRSHIRTPLQEKSSSETNASRPGKEKLSDVEIFTSTPFPTKPQHVLLPSTIRKQKSFHNAENFVPGFLAHSPPDQSWQPSSGRGTGQGLSRAPVLQLKKSVTTLRDMYEAQEKSSRPSTAASSGLRSMASNSRLRSASSSEGFAGRYAGDNASRISSDDLALLPSLNEAILKKMGSEHSFASRITRIQPLTSSPNYRVYESSSPKIPIFRDEPSLSSEDIEPSSSTGQEIVSSPNFVRLGRSSSMGTYDYTSEAASSPNFVKLGTSSPAQRTSSSPTSSIRSLKRKRQQDDEGLMFAHRAQVFNSSPPYMAPAATNSMLSIQSPSSLIVPSSPPEPVSASSQTVSTPTLPVRAQSSTDSPSSSDLHTSLQAALSSSPLPPIQYPVVRAPTTASYVLTVPKRNTRSGPQDGLQYPSRLSPVPFEWDESDITQTDLASASEEDLPETDSIEPAITGNESQIRIVTEDHSHEATDAVSALPRKYRSPPLIPARSNSLYGTLSTPNATHSQTRLNSLRLSMDSRLNSMKSFSHSRQNSFKSNSLRPTSSNSASASVTVPTWAKRYYSGFYRDSFQYLYAPSPNNSNAQLPAPQQYLAAKRSQSLIESSHGPSVRASPNSRYSLRSFRSSLRESISERIPSIIKVRMQARKSHMTAGIGPLVSNPTQPESVMLSDTASPTIRQVAEDEPPLSPVDPRAHWAGMSTASAGQSELSVGMPHSSRVHRSGSASNESLYYDADTGYPQIPPRSRFLTSPHLHRDFRLDTASSESRGFGHPFNGRPKFYPPPVHTSDNSGRPAWFSLDLRSTQVFLFILGFVLPLTWFLGSVLPLPRRPRDYGDLEKTEYDNATLQGQIQISEREELDIVSRLKMERHARGVEEAKWQNARWWRRMNRVMSIVGIVVIVVIVVLAVIGTKGGL